MAKISGLAQRFFVGGYDLSGDVGSIRRCSVTTGLFDVTGLDKTAKERIAGVSDSALEFDTFINTAAGQSHPVLSALPTTARIALYEAGTTIGAPVAAVTATQVDYKVTRPADGSILGSTDLLSAGGGGIEWGVNLVAGGAKTHASAAAEASLDNLASSASGAACFLQHFSRASGTAIYIIEHSTNNTVWATKATFALSGGATPGAERKTVSGTVNRYVRVSSTGTFTNARFAAGIRRGTAVDRVAYA